MNYHLSTDDPQFFFSPEITQAMQEVWTDEIIPASVEHSSRFYLMDSANITVQHLPGGTSDSGK